MNPTSEELVETLRLAQRLGFLGSGPIDQVVTQGDLFVAGLGGVVPGGRVVDLGSGGGSPALITAVGRPDLEFTLIDRRRKRTDFLMRAATRLRLENVEVRCQDVNALAREVTNGHLSAFDGLTARGFGPFDLLVSSMASLLTTGGVAAISDPPQSDRWSASSLGGAPLRLVERLQLEGRLDDGIAVLERLPNS